MTWADELPGGEQLPTTNNQGVMPVFGKRGEPGSVSKISRPTSARPGRAALRHIEFLDGELRLVDQAIAEQVLILARGPSDHDHPGDGAMAAAG